MDANPLAFGVLADDLTGALGSAARLRAAGFTPAVQWRVGPVPAMADALVVDMRTRDYATDPRTRAEGWARHLAALGCQWTELRIDSTLRGDPAAELRGFLAGLGVVDRPVLAVPAFPSAGRTTLSGQLLVNGRHTGTDVRATLFGGSPAELLDLDLLESGAQATAEHVRASCVHGVRRFVADATREEHLAILGAAASLLAPVLEGGLVSLSPGAWLSHLRVPSPRQSYVLVVLSSATETNAEQLSVLARHDGVRVVNARAVLAGETSVDWVGANPRTVVVETLSESTPNAPTAWLLSSLAARAAGMLMEQGRLLGYRCIGAVVGGGQTGSSFMDALGVTRLSVEREVAPLCPCGRLDGGDWAGLPMVTKGGLIGDRNTLTNLVQTLWKETK